MSAGHDVSLDPCFLIGFRSIEMIHFYVSFCTLCAPRMTLCNNNHVKAGEDRIGFDRYKKHGKDGLDVCSDWISPVLISGRAVIDMEVGNCGSLSLILGFESS